MDVFDRPLFQNRAARDRLKDMGNVQGFQVGGGVTADPSGAIIRQYRQRPIRPEGISSLVSEPPSFELVTLPGGEGPAGEFLYDRASGEVRLPDGSAITNPGIAETVSRNIQSYLSSGGGSRAPGLESGIEFFTNKAKQAAEDGYVGPSMDFAEQALGLRKQLDQLPEQADPVARYMDRDVLAVEGPEAMMMQMSPEQLDIFNNLDRAAEKPAPDVAAEKPALNPAAALTTPAAPAPPKGLSAMEADARDRGPRAPAALDRRSTMEADARDRGPLISDPTAVAAGLNSPEAEVRDKTIADFMQEFTSAAPKYEGTDKGLLLAQIGFAIAAGESPNAMQNIANGLLAGSDMLLKDKAAKSEFDRQLQLSAMQYGLQEMGKEREASRTGSFFVAAQPVTIGGRKYQPGESVFVSSATIAKDGVPQGLTTEAMADAVARNKAALDKALIEAKDAQKISVTEFNSLNEQLNLAAESFESNRALRPLVEASLVRAADGKVTGASSFFIETANKAANAVGVNLGTVYEDPEKYQKDMLKVGNRLVQEILRESGRTVSNVDRELVAQMVGQINNVQAQVTTDPDILVGTLQDILNVIDQNERAALDQYRTVTNATAGLYAPSGAPLELSGRATRVFENTAPIDMEDLFSYDEATGVWKPKVR